MATTTAYETSVDGVPCFGSSTPHEHVAARLMFAVGCADETFREVGVLHLLEHLAAGAARHAVVEMDASVDLEVTSFEASGPPQHVAAFLEQVCAALSEPPVERLASEARILAVEGAVVCAPIPAGLFAARHGAQHAGLALVDGPGPDGITVDQVRSTAARWFTRSNAVLHVLGDLPDGVRLPLRDGPVPQHVRRDLRLPDHAVAIGGPVPGAGVLLRLPDGAAAPRSFALVQVVLGALEEACRHRLGESYRSGVEDVAADPTQRDVAIFVDARPPAVRAVAETMLRELARLRTAGPSAEEMARLAMVLEHERTEPYRDSMEAAVRRLRILSGLEPPSPPDAATSVTPEMLRQDLDAALHGAVVYLHEDTEDDLDPSPFAPQPLCVSSSAEITGRTLRPPLLARALDGDARRVRLVVGDAGLAEIRDEQRHVMAWTDVVGVERGRSKDDPAFVVYSRTGCEVTLDDDVFPGSEAIVGQLRASIDPDLFFDRTELSEE